MTDQQRSTPHCRSDQGRQIQFATTQKYSREHVLADVGVRARSRWRSNPHVVVLAECAAVKSRRLRGTIWPGHRLQHDASTGGGCSGGVDDHAGDLRRPPAHQGEVAAGDLLRRPDRHELCPTRHGRAWKVRTYVSRHIRRSHIAHDCAEDILTGRESEEAILSQIIRRLVLRNLADRVRGLPPSSCPAWDFPICRQGETIATRDSGRC
jgi:hypothetical protein